MKKRIGCFLLITIFCIIVFKTGDILAIGNIFVKSDIAETIKGQEFEISINSSIVSISALQLELHFDDNKVEYIFGPENSNQINNTILYTWFDETGGSNPKQNEEIVKFKFKGKEAGEAVFGLNGIFFDKDGNELINTSTGESIYIVNEHGETIEKSSTNIRDNNSNLQIMRIGIEGISPDFNKNILNYYITVNPSVSNLNIVAIPEHPEAIVNITGNVGLKSGLNKITIEVISKDGSQRTVYTINVTVTSEPSKANTNLETLAIEYFNILPELSQDVTHYKAIVTSDITRVNIFAVPENYLAKVDISNVEGLQFGDNFVTVTVTAEDGITKKDYIINVYKQTPQQEEQELKKQEENVKRLAQIIEGKEEKEQTNNKLVPVILLLIILVSVILAVVVNKRIKATDKSK